jgi:GNAT superfamily N-acetyltransferase
MQKPSPSDLQLRVASDADVPAAIDLMRVALGEGKIPRTREFFDWKHQQNPFGQSPMWVAESQGKLVGLRLFMRWAWAWGAGSLSSAVRAVDTATHPEFQGRGIFKRLTLSLVKQVTDQGVELVFNTPNDKSRPGYLKMGWTSAGRVALWLRPEASPRALRKLLRLPTPPAAVRDEPTETSNQDLLAAVREADSAGLLARDALPQSAGRYRTPRDASYLRWRYAACPAARYYATSSDPSRALVIHRVRERNGLRELSIAELLFEPSLAGMRCAISALAQARRAARADYALVAFERDRAQAMVLSAAGFLPAPGIGPVVTTRPLNTQVGAPDPLRIESFRASIGDLELF